MRRFALACAIAAPVAGLVIGNREQTYDDVGPLIARSCAPCHSPGGPAPFYLRNYDEARRRAERIGINVASMAMPPCQIRSDFGAFPSVPGLTTEEVVAIRRWATGGAPAGTGGDVTSEPINFSWRLGPPHRLIKSPKITAPAEGGVHWIFVKVPLAKGGMIRGLQLKPKDPRTIRQAMIGWAPAGVSLPGLSTALAPEVTPMGASAFGYYTWRLPRGAAVWVPPGSELHVMLQCQATGRPGDATFELGLYFEQGTPAPAQTLMLKKEPFTIDIGEKPTFVIEETLPVDAEVTALFPEFRYACEKIQLTAHLPDGEVKTLAAGRWDVYWTGAYNFIAPARLPKGTILRLEASYNNGFEATHGPDVRVPIRSGTGLDDELCRLTVQYVAR